MVEIDIFSGFLGAGKTTLIKKLIREAFPGEKLVLIENEFGEIGIDGAFLRETGQQSADLAITEMNSGCICCSLVGDFAKSLSLAIERFHPDRILIEPSGVGKLSEVAAAVARLDSAEVVPGCRITVADALRCRMYAKNFGEFYTDQIASADLVVLSRTAGISPEKLNACVETLRSIRADIRLVTTPWDELDGKQIFVAAKPDANWAAALLAEAQQLHDEDDDECDDPDCECHRHHGEEDGGGEEHHHPHEDDDEEECRHGHHHHHHHGHDADEVFQSWGKETPRSYSADEIEAILSALADSEAYGTILRAKGIVPAPDGSWHEFDYVPGEARLRAGSPEVIGKLCVIGSGLRETALSALFGGI